MTTQTLLPKLARPPGSEAEQVALALREGSPFVCLREDDVPQRAATLAAVLQACADFTEKVVWIGNPLRSPLTVERFFLQAAGPELDVRLERDPTRLAELLSEAAGGSRRLMVVQQPESIDGELRELLTGMGPLLSRVQILFCGSRNFRPPSAPASLAPLPTGLVIEPLRPRKRRRRLILVLVAILMGAGMAAAWTFRPQVGPEIAAPEQRAPVGPVQSTPPSNQATLEPSQAAAATAPPQPSAPTTDVAPVPASGGQAVVNVSSLRQQFDQFLTERSPRLASLSPSQRDALFQEFLRSRNLRSP